MGTIQLHLSALWRKFGIDANKHLPVMQAQSQLSVAMTKLPSCHPGRALRETVFKEVARAPKTVVKAVSPEQLPLLLSNLRDRRTRDATSKATSLCFSTVSSGVTACPLEAGRDRFAERRYRGYGQRLAPTCFSSGLSSYRDMSLKKTVLCLGRTE